MQTIQLKMLALASVLASALADPPDAGYGVSSDADYANCVLTCRDLGGAPAPHLCHSLGVAPPRPPSRVDVHAAHGGGARDNFQYGQNGSEWRQWLPANGKALTSISVFNSAAYGTRMALGGAVILCHGSRAPRAKVQHACHSTFNSGGCPKQSNGPMTHRTAMFDHVHRPCTPMDCRLQLLAERRPALHRPCPRDPRPGHGHRGRDVRPVRAGRQLCQGEQPDCDGRVHRACGSYYGELRDRCDHPDHSYVLESNSSHPPWWQCSARELQTRTMCTANAHGLMGRRAVITR